MLAFVDVDGLKEVNDTRGHADFLSKFLFIVLIVAIVVAVVGRRSRV